MQVKDFKAVDKGTWEVFKIDEIKLGVISSDFEHDVVLYINGDFSDYNSKLEYAESLAAYLNKER